MIPLPVVCPLPNHFRGYDEAVRRANVPSRPASVSPSRPSSAPPDPSESEKSARRKSFDARTAARYTNDRGRSDVGPSHHPGTPINTEDSELPQNEAKVGEGRSGDVSDLIFVVHGIGQGVS